MLKKISPILLLFTALFFALSACTTADEPVESDPVSEEQAATEIETGTETEAEEPAAAPESNDYLIAGVVFQSDTFMQLIQAGFEQAAEDAGAELLLGNTENDLAKESDMIDDYITRGVDAIVITPISADGSTASLKRAKEAGITIICFNTCVTEEGIASAFLVTENIDLGLKSGEAAAAFIENELGGEAKIGLLNCDPFPEACDPRKDGFVGEVTKLPGVEVVADQTGFIADEALSVSEAMLQANPEINILWGANEGGTVAHVLAVQSSGVQGEVFVFGTDMNNQMAQMLQSDDNVLQGVTGQAPFQMGVDSLNLALEMLDGGSIEYNQTTPTIYFGGGNDGLINQFVETEGKAIFDTSATPVSEAPANAPADDLVIAGVVFQSDTFMQLVQAGIQQAADDLGAELILGNTENDLAKEGDMIDDYITRGVDAIVITPISADGSTASLKRAQEAGITIICFNTCVNEEGIASAFLVTENIDLGLKSGAAAVEFIETELGGEAKIGLLNCDPFPEGCDPRKEGFVGEVSKLPGVEIVADQTGYIADEALPVAEAMLQAHPDINVLWGANEGGTVGHALAVQSSGLQGEVFVFGTDMNNQMAQMLQSGDNVLQGVTGQSPFQMGYDAMNVAYAVLSGDSVEYNQKTPTIYFGRGNDELIDSFVDTEGKAVFEE